MGHNSFLFLVEWWVCIRCRFVPFGSPQATSGSASCTWPPEGPSSCAFSPHSPVFKSFGYTWIHAVFTWDPLCSSNSMLSPERSDTLESSSEPQFLTQVFLLGLVFPCSTQILMNLRESMSPWMWRARRSTLWTVVWPLTCPIRSSWGPKEVWISSSPLTSQPGQVIPALLSK